MSDRIAKQDELPARQAAIADLNLGVVDATTLIANASTIQTKLNAVIAALRAAGIIAT